MADNEIRNAIICGSGPAGYTAGIYLSRANLAPLLLAGPQVGGQLTTTTTIENYPGFAEGQDGNQLMIDMETQAKNCGTEIEYESATGLEIEDNHYILHTTKGPMKAYTIIVCTGASPRMLGIPTEQTFWNFGVHTCAVCDGGFYRGKEVAVIGGGDSAMEEATYLAKLCSKVYIVHRRDELRASKIMADRALKTSNIEFVWNSAVDEVKGEVESQIKKKVHALKLKDTRDGSESEIEVSAMFLAIGHTPNTAWLDEKLETNDSGYIKVDAHQHTNLPGVFAAGDVHDNHYRQAITAAGFGCMAALEAERFLVRHGIG